MGESADELRWALKRLQERRPADTLARRYYDGDHDLRFMTKQFKAVFGEFLKASRYNRCPSVVDAIADKLQVTGFADEGGADDLAAAAGELWRRNRMDREAGAVHLEALTIGQGGVIVWPEADGVRIYPQEGTRIMLRGDDEDPRLSVFGAKLWRLADGRWRANAYHLDRVEKFISPGKSAELPSASVTWERWDGDGLPWPLYYPWGEGVPLFVLANDARLGRPGVSELRDVIPLQDALNKSLGNMIVAGEYVAFPQRWAIGLELTKDEETGEYKAPFRPGPGQLWTMFAGDDGKAAFGDFATGDVTQFTTEQDSLDQKISRVARVPVHWLGMTSGQFPSGESLKTAEAPFSKKIRDRQIAYGNFWEDVMTFALRLELGIAPGEASLSTLWESAEPRSDQDFWTVAALKLQAGIPEEQIWEEAGYTQEQIASFRQAKRQAEAEARQRMGALGDLMARSLNDQPPPEGDPASDQAAD